jgi:hypothetical protein
MTDKCIYDKCPIGNKDCSLNKEQTLKELTIIETFLYTLILVGILFGAGGIIISVTMWDFNLRFFKALLRIWIAFSILLTIIIKLTNETPVKHE